MVEESGPSEATGIYLDMILIHNQDIIQDPSAELDSYISILTFSEPLEHPVLFEVQKAVNARIRRYGKKKATIENCKEFYNSVLGWLTQMKTEGFIKSIPEKYQERREELQEAIEELLDSIHSGFEKPYGVSDEEWLEITSVSGNQPTHPYSGYKPDGTVEGYIKSRFEILSKMSVIGFYNSGMYRIIFKTLAMKAFNEEHPEAYELAKKDAVIAQRITNYLTTTILDTFCYVISRDGGPYRPAVHSGGKTPQNWERITSWEQIISGKHLTYNEILGIYEDDEAVSSAVVEVSVNQEQKVAV